MSDEATFFVIVAVALGLLALGFVIAAATRDVHRLPRRGRSH